MLKDLVGRSSEDCELPDRADLRSVFEVYAARHARLRDLAPSIVVARNQEFAEMSALLKDGDEVAFLPPVSGGSGGELELTQSGNYFALTRHAIDSRAIAARVLAGTDGAVVTFEGVVRNNSKGRHTRYLDYECYESMALKMMCQIGAEIASTHEIGKIAMVHRLGRLLIGEASVAIVVTAPHRRAAFEAALEGINRLKKVVPIWKKEYFADGEVWVEGEWDENVPVAG
jgi:molybdopterin synthase catalytic subunit/molybdopterin converting factor small subunit